MSIFSRLAASNTPTSSDEFAPDALQSHSSAFEAAALDAAASEADVVEDETISDFMTLSESGDAESETITFACAARIGATKRPPVAFEEIVEKYHGKVFQLVYRYIGDYDEACDLTQDTFVRAYAAWGDFRGESQIYTWLYRIAINLCHNQQKKLQRRRRVERVSLDSAPDNDSNDSGAQWSSREVADERPLPLQVLESHEMRLHLQAALRELPENYRTVIVLRDIEGLSYEEIARITDSTLEAIKSRLFRARGAIRRLMEPYFLGENESAAQKKVSFEETASEQPNVAKRRRFRLL